MIVIRERQILEFAWTVVCAGKLSSASDELEWMYVKHWSTLFVWWLGSISAIGNCVFESLAELQLLAMCLGSGNFASLRKKFG